MAAVSKAAPHKMRPTVGSRVFPLSLPVRLEWVRGWSLRNQIKKWIEASTLIQSML